PPPRNSLFPYTTLFRSQYMYEVISNANLLISKIDAVSMDETKKKRIIAQARFLRALAYRDLTDGWGPVPLYTEVVPPDQTKNARSEEHTSELQSREKLV